MVAACKSSGGDGGTDETTGPGSTTGATDDGATSDPSSTTSGAVDSSSGGDDMPGGGCILWETEACGAGQKCMPWSLEPDRIPDDIRCCPAMENPDVENDPCTITDYDGSCVDSCDKNTLCVLDDIETLSGQCRRFCNPAASDCDADDTCKTFFELLPGAPNVPLCMDKCDPLLQDCSLPTWQCIPDSPTVAGQSGFICVSPPPQAPVGLFGQCFLANDCQKGLVCVSAGRVPDCPDTPCCTAYCDLGDGDAACQAIDPGVSCVDWMAPDPQWDHVGVCAIPE